MGHVESYSSRQSTVVRQSCSEKRLLPIHHRFTSRFACKDEGFRWHQPLARAAQRGSHQEVRPCFLLVSRKLFVLFRSRAFQRKVSQPWDVRVSEQCISFHHLVGTEQPHTQQRRLCMFHLRSRPSCVQLMGKDGLSSPSSVDGVPPWLPNHRRTRLPRRSFHAGRFLGRVCETSCLRPKSTSNVPLGLVSTPMVANPRMNKTWNGERCQQNKPEALYRTTMAYVRHSF